MAEHLGTGGGDERPGVSLEGFLHLGAGLEGLLAPGVDVAPGGEILERNLRALERASGETVGLLRATPPRQDVQLETAPDGAITGSLGQGAARRQLASARRPREEAARFAAGIDPQEAGVIVVLGFGLGHHVAALADRMGRAGIILVFEPDTALLRAALAAVDHSEVFARSNVAVLTRAEDAAAISAALRGAEAVVSLGVRVIEHAPSTPRLGGQGTRFGETFTSCVRAVRTNLVTTLMQTETSLRNGLMNLDWYASVPGVGELTGCAAGRPAVVVSAGPSLRRNVELLLRPGVRDRVVIIATQTVLRPLLELGIRPHFVTALDYHEISARFYEGLTARDVEGVTLVAEPKANPAILESFPGAIRCPHDKQMSKTLGAGFAHDGVSIEPGGTVAHMAYTLARHLGCDPVILIGQDLGFTDGQYYAPGAAIHDVWAGELSPCNTLEMMEWQRVVRNRAHLHRATDHLGRPVYTDEQMSAYAVQFERMFAADVRAGRRVIDATEGGLAKRHAEVMPLAEALERFSPRSAPLLELPSTAPADQARRLGAPRVAARLGQVRRDIRDIEDLSRTSAGLLETMLEHHADQRRVNQLIEKVHGYGERAMGLAPAFELVQHLNQTGQLKRFKADRALHFEGELTPIERQRRQIERDIVNVRWLAESAGQLGKLFDASADAMRGEAAKLTRDPEEQGLSEIVVEAAPSRVAAILAVDAERGGLGTARRLARELSCGLNPLQLTLLRLARSTGLDEIVLLSEDPDSTRRIAGAAPESVPFPVRFERTGAHPLGERRRGVARARALAPDAWRGGLCGMTVFDEAFDPVTTLAVMDRLGIDGAVVLGPDWVLVEPELTSTLIERFREDPAHRRLCFSQAAPGLAPCVIARSLVSELAASAATAGGFASIGGLLGYIPMSPILDPVAKPGCVRVGPDLRDVGLRVIADSPWRVEVIERALRECALPPTEVGATAIAPRIRAAAEVLATRGPAQLTLELCAGRRTGGELAQMLAGGRGAADRPMLSASDAVRIIEELASMRPDATLTLGGAGDPMMHPRWRDIVAAAAGAGLAGVHVRTDLQCPPEEAASLLECGAGVVSIDLLAESASTYRRLAGLASFERARDGLVALLKARTAVVGGRMPDVWIVPRITRCDAVYEELESFYDRWLTVAQACIIDPLPASIEGDRIAPLPEPRLGAWHRSLTELIVLSDGGAISRPGRVFGRSAANAIEGGLPGAWRQVLGVRRQRREAAEAIGREERRAVAA
ncbi:MAG: DUF115 domain-containing protein [Phycisphaerales bacterium]|nr:DUF115 domain-containing protein [Phycisphaerales bacterium]